MEYRKTDVSHIQQLWELHRAYKAEIEEDTPSGENRL